ncbi:YtxH domain-containing protein [Paenibacillus tarimensis]
MLMRNQNKPKSFLWGIIAGSVVGAVSALLLAPKSGRELRKDLADRAQQAGESTARVANQAREQTGKFVQQVGSQTTQFAGKTKQAIQDIRGWRSTRQTEVRPDSAVEQFKAEVAEELAETAEAAEAADTVQNEDVQELLQTHETEEVVKF